MRLDRRLRALFVSGCSSLGVRLLVFVLRANGPPPRMAAVFRFPTGLRRKGVHRFALDPPSSTRQVNLDGPAQAGCLRAGAGVAATGSDGAVRGDREVGRPTD